MQSYVSRTYYLPDPKMKSVISNATIVFSEEEEEEEAVLDVMMASIFWCGVDCWLQSRNGFQSSLL